MPDARNAIPAPRALGERSIRGGDKLRPDGLNWHKPEDDILNILTGDGPWNYKAIQVRRQAKLQAFGQADSDPWAAMSQQERKAARCRAELERPTITWSPITLDVVKQNHFRSAPGLFYGLEFPWTAQGLSELGPEWLTEAFHAAKTLPEDNWITGLVMEKVIKITAGNNAAKFLFEVKYARPSPELHTKLFAKCCFPMTPATQTDRLSSSVYKQPMDFLELNTYRCLEGSLPVNTPKFYFGDISNETSNWVLITERVLFTEIHGIDLSKEMKPFDIEGPYDKCKDWMLRGEDKEYYLLLCDQHARIAAAYKQGKIPWNYGTPPTDPAAYAMNPKQATGESPTLCRTKLQSALRFMSETAAPLYQPYLSEEDFQNRWTDTMLKLNAYSNELRYWKMKEQDYVSLGHGNLNTDNAYFWRDGGGQLDCGIFDFGGFGVSSLPHNLWWMLNMAEIDQVMHNLDTYIEAFVSRYKEYGGPSLDLATVRMMVIITALQNTSMMVAAVPNTLKMCPAKEWATIKDRHDPRVASNVDGKSTLRSCVHVLNSTTRIFEELSGGAVLEQWVQEVYVGQWGKAAKSEAVINTGQEGGTARWGV